MEISENTAITYSKEVLYAKFQELNDLNDSRGTDSEYIVTEFAELDAEYPIVVIESAPSSVSSGAGAGNYLQSQTEVNGDISKFHFKKVRSTIFITCVTKKDDEFEVTFPDASTGLVGGSRLNEFFASMVTRFMDDNDDYFRSKFDDFEVVTIDPTYESDENMWATMITLEVTYKDIYKKTTASTDVIATTELNLQVNN